MAREETQQSQRSRYSIFSGNPTWKCCDKRLFRRVHIIFQYALMGGNSDDCCLLHSKFYRFLLIRVGSGQSSEGVFQVLLDLRPHADESKDWVLSKLNAVGMYAAGEIIQCGGNFCGWRSSSMQIYMSPHASWCPRASVLLVGGAYKPLESWCAHVSIFLVFIHLLLLKSLLVSLRFGSPSVRTPLGVCMPPGFCISLAF